MPINDLVSVIISAYNHERYIEECVRSIMAQTYQNIELLVIDDGSTDSTFAKLQELKPECEKRFVRFVLETQKNCGTRVTGNKLIDMAQGKYIYALASDDAAKPDAIEKLYTFLAANQDYVLAVGDNEMIDADSQRIYWDDRRNVVPQSQAVCETVGDDLHINPKNNKHQDFGNYADLLKSNYIPNGYLYLRPAMLDVGKYDESVLLEDWYMHLQLSKVGKYKYFPEVLFSYRWHTTNTITSQAFKDKVKEIYRQIYEHEKEYCFTHGYKKLWKKLWSKNFGWGVWRKKMLNIRFSRRKKIVRLFGITFYEREE